MERGGIPWHAQEEGPRWMKPGAWMVGQGDVWTKPRLWRPSSPRSS